MKKFFMCIGAAALIFAASAGGAAAQDRGVAAQDSGVVDQDSSVDAQDRGGEANAEFVPGEVIIGFTRKTTAAEIRAALWSIGGQVVSRITFPTTKVLRVQLADATALGTEAAVQQLRENRALVGRIKYAEPNIIQRAHDERQSGDAVAQTQSSDPSLTEQWGYYDIGAHWVQPTGAQKTIAVLDTGVDYTHPELVGKVIKGKDFVNNDNNPMDDHGHGTHVSGIAAAKANNAFGIAGVAWNAKILAVKVLNSQGRGTTYDIAAGIKYAANNGSVRVINMSLGGSYPTSTQQDAVNYAVNTKMKLLVASAGNAGTTTKNYPAAYAETYPGKVIAVAAHQPNLCKASFSTYGTWVTISAPGTDILSSVPGGMYPGYNGFDSWNGTSMAAPFVAGAATVVWAKYPTYTNTQIANLLTTNTYPVGPRNDTCWPVADGSYGRLNLSKAMTNGGICTTVVSAPFGYASDAENGEPLAGAKVQVYQGTTLKGTDYVPYYGYLAQDGGTVFMEGYGLFSALASPLTGPNPPVDAKITKTGYASYTAKNLPYVGCSWTYAGNIPVPPKTGLYWVAVTTDYGQTLMNFDLFGKHPNGVRYYYQNVGDLNAPPYMKFLWDSDNSDYADTLRFYSETIRIKQQVAGTYKFSVNAWTGGGDDWISSGMKAYIYKGSTLVKEITPAAGTGTWWYIADINGSTVTEVNTIGSSMP